MNGEPVGNVEVGGSDMERPRQLAVHSMHRLVLWTDVGLQSVWRSRLDSTERRQVVGQLNGVTAMAVDQQADLVFVAHGKSIEMMGLEGQNR